MKNMRCYRYHETIKRPHGLEIINLKREMSDERR